MNFLVQHHSKRRCDFLDLVFAEIEFLAYRRTVCACGNGIDNLALRSSERTVQSINILGGGNLIDCALKSTHRIDRLIQAACFIDGAEHFARFGYGNRAFLCHIGAYHLNDGNAAVNLGVLLHYIKIDRLGVQYIAIRRLYLYQRIALAVFQGLRRNKLAIGGCVKDVNGRHFGIGEGHRHKVSVRVVNLEACACIRNGVARFRIFLHDLDIAFKVCVVDKIAVGLTVLADKHIKGLHQLTTLPTRGLADGVDTVRHILCLGKAVFITSENISLGFLCSIKAACRLAEYFKGCACFGRFNLRFAVVGMLDNGDIALDDLFGHIICGRVKLHGVKLWLCADPVDCSVKQIALRRADFSDSPIVAAHIILRCKLTVFIGGVGVNEFFALINAVDCTCKRGVALRRTHFCIGFRYGHIEFFENVCKAAVRYLFPFDRRCLRSGNNIAHRRVNFLYGVRCRAADKHIFKSCNTVCVGHGVFINGQTA